MNLYQRCYEYSRVGPADARLPLATISCANVAVCAYGAVVAAYVSVAASFADLQFLQYWLVVSLLVTVAVTVTLYLRQADTEAHEIVYELKMLHAMYFGIALVRYGVLDTDRSAGDAVLVTNLVHCCALVLLLMELTLLLGHALHVFADYRYVKTYCALAVFLALSALLLTSGASGLKGAPLCDSLLMTTLVSVAYLLTAIVWAARKEAANLCVQRAHALHDPPPSFAEVEMEDFYKTKN